MDLRWSWQKRAAGSRPRATGRIGRSGRRSCRLTRGFRGRGCRCDGAGRGVAVLGGVPAGGRTAPVVAAGMPGAGAAGVTTPTAAAAESVAVGASAPRSGSPTSRTTGELGAASGACATTTGAANPGTKADTTGCVTAGAGGGTTTGCTVGLRTATITISVNNTSTAAPPPRYGSCEVCLGTCIGGGVFSNSIGGAARAGIGAEGGLWCFIGRAGGGEERLAVRGPPGRDFHGEGEVKRLDPMAERPV